MTALCHERLPFNTTPRLAMDAAPPPTGNGELIGDGTILQILDLLRGLLDDATFKKVEGPLMAKSKMSMDQPTAVRTIDPENVEQAVALLRAQGVDEDLIKKVCAVAGTGVPTVAATQAQDAAVRDRHARSYAARFPGHIGGDAKLPSQSSAKSYAERFPGAGRIKIAY